MSMSLAAAYTWDNEGRMTSLQYPTGYMPYGPYHLPTAGYTYDVNGRMSGMTWDTGNGDGPQPYAGATYGPAGQMLTLSYANGSWTETRTYNSLLQLTSQVVPYYINMTYSYSATQNNGRITGSVDGGTGENTAYSYDALNRLTGASNSLWSEAYGYDGFGNLTSKQGSGGSPTPAPSMSVSYDANNHQAGTSYDGNGNQLSADGNTNSYTVENRMNSQYAVAWPYAQGLSGYDPWGKRVMRQTDPDPYSYSTGSSPSLAFNFYGITGQRLATATCVPTGGTPSCFFSGQNVYFGKKLLVSNGVNVVTDRLGSVRANLQGEGFAYYPYGEEQTSTVDGREKFGTYFRDGVGQDYADQRYYGSGTGRFWSADPGGIKTANAGNPTSWNRYAYVNGDPINRFDPTGRIDVAPGDGGGCVDVGDGDDGEDVCVVTSDSGGGDSDDNDDTDTDPCTNSTAMFCVTGTGQMPPDPNPAPPSTSLVPTAPVATGVLDTILTGIGTMIRTGLGIILFPTPTSGCDTLSCQGKLPVPTVEYVESNCTRVGPPVIVPSTKKGNKGGQSIEQEYLCPDGNTYTIHTLTNPQGKPIDKHSRPGKPKYGPPGGQ